MKSNRSIPYITTAQMVEVDRLMIEKYKIGLIQMMENAGRNLAELTIDKYLNSSYVNTVMILAGSGGNGGGALVCARHLHNRGVNVVACLTRDFSNEETVSAHQLRILQKLNIKIILPVMLDDQKDIDFLIDGVIGYNLKGKLSTQVTQIVDWANAQNSKILALDIPTGLESTTGNIYSKAIKADATMTLALPKTGMNNPSVKDYVGELYLADISVPLELYEEPSLNIKVSNIFENGQIIKL